MLTGDGMLKIKEKIKEWIEEEKNAIIQQQILYGSVNKEFFQYYIKQYTLILKYFEQGRFQRDFDDEPVDIELLECGSENDGCPVVSVKTKSGKTIVLEFCDGIPKQLPEDW